MSALSHKSQGPGPKISFLFARSLSSSLCRNDRAQQLLGEVHVAGFISTSASGLLMTKLSGEIRICGCISCTFWLKSALVKQSSCMPCRWMFQSLSLKSLIWKLSCKLCWFFFGLWNLVIIFSFFFFFLLLSANLLTWTMRVLKNYGNEILGGGSAQETLPGASLHSQFQQIWCQHCDFHL